jgi:hypothetical protein
MTAAARQKFMTSAPGSPLGIVLGCRLVAGWRPPGPTFDLLDFLEAALYALAAARPVLFAHVRGGVPQRHAIGRLAIRCNPSVSGCIGFAPAPGP